MQRYEKYFFIDYHLYAINVSINNPNKSNVQKHGYFCNWDGSCTVWVIWHYSQSIGEKTSVLS